MTISMDLVSARARETEHAVRTVGESGQWTLFVSSEPLRQSSVGEE